MKAIWNWIQVAFAAIGGFLGWFLGGLDGFLYALIAFVVIDYLTGVMCAIADKKLSSEIGAKGIFKKVLIFVLVGVGHIIDSQVLGDGGGHTRPQRIGQAHQPFGLPIPEKLKSILEQLHDRDDKKGGDGS